MGGHKPLTARGKSFSSVWIFNQQLWQAHIYFAQFHLSVLKSEEENVQQGLKFAQFDVMTSPDVRSFLKKSVQTSFHHHPSFRELVENLGISLDSVLRGEIVDRF